MIWKNFAVLKPLVYKPFSPSSIFDFVLYGKQQGQGFKVFTSTPLPRIHATGNI
jgi:hypothetical protein